jgi:hypothetical protein
VARVEPSALGGRKMAELLLDAVHNDGIGMSVGTAGAPTASLIEREAK